MDIVRAPQKKTGKYVGIGIGVLVLVIATWRIMALPAAAPTVELANLLTDTVRRGDVVREVRGPGNLTPDHYRFITPQTNGRVENIVAVVGQVLNAGDVILVMSSPDQQIASTRAEQAVRQAELDLSKLRNDLQTQLSNLEIQVASAKTTQLDAQQRAREADSLFNAKLLAPFEANRLKLAADEAATRYRIAQQQLKSTNEMVESQLNVAKANVEALKAIAANEQDRLKSLTVRAPEAGVLQQDQLLNPGQWVTSGQTIARIVQPGKLKAVLRIPESQANLVQIGQMASIDTRNGLIPGHVSRKDPTAIGGSVNIDVALEGALPSSAVPELSVDGTIQIEHLKDVLFTGRPVSGAATGPVGMFKFVEGGKYAVRTTVQLGRSSVNTVEIINGLQPGDRVILTDMSQYDQVDRVRIK
ncbi:MAG TPA: HlyD family efflux transporter periplasmic adaptor subunit [Gemmatimonadaceae bacterium]|nr:HlyD family efflux transporter periplasmic adaptor subunit [Gemmatimonadaceae bacterium]